ncbi:TonB-dependent receptor [Marinigracilibium pacificum]|uniref:TonB-dependent receptor n=1 Tax=Marinigracilibium pacificum TaxID=2729599 RepID=A0A848IZS5_9BACT|nr:TonB-dependent receptor [Marinigracilibium pacificum]NMM48785.1 TonB-dependent receptor [Marinigracilibium pacificum]
MGKLKLLIITLLISFYSFGQTEKISGIVYGEGQPVPGATIKTTYGTGTVTDENGNFSLDITEHNDLTLIVSCIGFKAKEIEVSPGDKISVNLEENILGLNEVTITGSMMPNTRKNSPVKVEVISSRQLEEFIPSGGSSLMESFKMINGVNEVIACGVCYTNSVSINGLPGSYTAILINGTPLFGNLASVYGLNSIPTSIIERLEVVRGPASTLYGSEAMAGVINVITKDQYHIPKLAFDIMGSSFGEVYANGIYSTRLGKTNGVIAINGGHKRHFRDVNDDQFNDMVDLDRISMYTLWDINQKNNNKFKLGAQVYYEDRRNGVKDYLTHNNYRETRGNDSIYGESIYTKRFMFFGDYEFANIKNLNINFSVSSHDQNSYYGSDLYEATQHTGFVNLTKNFSADNHKFISGLTFRYNHYDDNTVATESNSSNGIENDPSTQFVPGVFIEDEWSINDSWKILGGLRLDYFSLNGLIPSPRLHVKKKFSPVTSTSLSFGTGFRIINLFTEDHAFVSGQREIVIEEDLNPEKSYNIALNFNHIYTFNNNQGMFDVDMFYTRFSNRITPDYDTPGEIIYRNTQGYFVSRGINLSNVIDFHNGITLNQGINIQEVYEINNNEYSSIEFSPKWTALSSISYKMSKAGLTSGLNLRLNGPVRMPLTYDISQSGEPVARPQWTPAYLVADLKIEKSFNHDFSIYGGVNNIFNYIQKYSPISGTESVDAPLGFADNFDTSYNYGPVAGRNFYLGLKWELPFADSHSH